jgi:endonuclease III-like uncharacterized protein
MRALFSKVFEETTTLQERAIAAVKEKGVAPAIAEPDGFYGRKTKKLLADADIDLAKTGPTQTVSAPPLTAAR